MNSNSELDPPVALVAIFQDPQEAAFAKSLLESCGIKAVICNEHLYRVPIGLHLQVAEKDVETAKDLLKQFSEEKGE